MKSKYQIKFKIQINFNDLQILKNKIIKLYKLIIIMCLYREEFL